LAFPQIEPIAEHSQPAKIQYIPNINREKILDFPGNCFKKAINLLKTLLKLLAVFHT